jgi:hypothetical protein
VDPSRLALVQGLQVTRVTLRRWRSAPAPVLLGWTVGALGVSVALLGAVWVVAVASTPDITRVLLPGLTLPADGQAVAHVLLRNSLVLALHGMACVAGFIAGSSLPLQAEHHGGRWRIVHDRAGPLAILFVVLATGFSLVTQALVLGQGAATLADALQISELVLVVTLLPHALLELVALFLPLAAWMAASRRGEWHVLLAATVATCSVAVPVLVVASLVEVFLWPDLLRTVSPRV